MAQVEVRRRDLVLALAACGSDDLFGKRIEALPLAVGSQKMASARLWSEHGLGCCDHVFGAPLASAFGDEAASLVSVVVE